MPTLPTALVAGFADEARRLRHALSAPRPAALAVGVLFLAPALHPLLIPAIGIPSHLLWWIHVMPVALVVYRGSPVARRTVVPGSAALLVAGERLFGFGYGVPADWHTVTALASALTFTNMLVAGFALYARNTERQLQHNALHDPLTGLPNRVLFMDRLERALARCRRSRLRFATLFLDLDRFKVVNDGLGHVAGDELLKEIARRLTECVREADTVARIGGDEFIILLEDVGDAREATRTADRVQGALRTPFRLGAYDVTTSASIGITLGADGDMPADALMRDADTAMYRAKAKGRARAEIFDAEMYAEALRLLELETDLRGAVERGELVLHFQPLVGLERAEVVAFEALLRWRHPRHGLLHPSAFLALAEDSGMSVALGEWVLRETCRAVSLFESRPGLTGPWRIAINLSPRQLAFPGLAQSIAAILRDTGTRAERIAIEVTESAVMDAQTAMSAMSALKRVGVELWIDDFGSGYSSLSHLHRFPFDVLKIDRAFIHDLGEGTSKAIIRAIVALARQLSLGVVAEGVETSEQLDIVRALDCGAAQGYHLARPMPIQETVQWCAGHLQRHQAEASASASDRWSR